MRLTLKREVLAALTAEELGSVRGGALPTTPARDCLATLHTAQVNDCVRVSDAPSCLDCATRAC